MAAAINVVQGPDAGWRFVMVAGEVRLGRGAGHQVKLSDPAWGDGHLRVQFRHGGYLITNLMPYPVFLDGQLLGEGQQATWYAGGSLQPTATTLLRLEMAEAPSGPAPEGGVYVVPPGQANAAGKKNLQWVALALVALVLLGLGVSQLRKSTKPAKDSYAAIDMKLAAVETADKRVGPIRETLGVAAFRESGNDFPDAYRKYQEARQLLADVRNLDPNTPTAGALSAAKDFVEARLAALARNPAVTKSSTTRARS